MSDSRSDSHTVLGLARGASVEDARAAYRRLAKRFHPDAPGGDKEKFHALSEAHATFHAGTHIPMPNARRNLVSGFWKIAKTIPKPPQNGTNREAVLRVSLEDALKGAIRRVTLSNGQALDVSCPAGCANDDVIRLKGAGDPGKNGGKNGDALIKIRLLTHKRADLKGRDLHMPLWLDLTQLRNGAKVEVSTPHGPLRVRIPALSNHGQSLRLKGLGLPAYEQKQAGHLFFTLKSRRAAGFTEALGRFSRIWANPIRIPVRFKT